MVYDHDNLKLPTFPFSIILSDYIERWNKFCVYDYERLLIDYTFAKCPGYRYRIKILHNCYTIAYEVTTNNTVYTCPFLIHIFLE